MKSTEPEDRSGVSPARRMLGRLFSVFLFVSCLQFATTCTVTGALVLRDRIGLPLYYVNLFDACGQVMPAVQQAAGGEGAEVSRDVVLARLSASLDALEGWRSLVGVEGAVLAFNLGHRGRVGPLFLSRGYRNGHMGVLLRDGESELVHDWETLGRLRAELSAR